MSAVWETVSQNARLVTLPGVYLRLKAVLDAPNSNLADVAEVVGNDPAMTVRLLKIVNSAYFGLGVEIDTVNRAVGLLGTQEVHDLVLAASVTQSFNGMSNDVMNMQKFWRHSVVCAITARELASLCNALDSERLFVVGLLRDIGHLFIYQLAPEMAQEAIELAQAQDTPLYKAERALLGVDYAKVGADMMRQWQLPQSLWEPAEYHVEPAKSQDYGVFTSLLHIATHLTDGVDRGVGLEVVLAGVLEHAWETTGLSPEQCADISDRVQVQVSAVMRLIFPSLKTSAA